MTLATFVEHPPSGEADHTFKATSNSALNVYLKVSQEDGFSCVCSFSVEKPLTNHPEDVILPIPGSQTACVLIQGTAFLLDLSNPVETTLLPFSGQLVSYYVSKTARLIVFATPWRIFAVDEFGIRWESDRLAIDGILIEGESKAGILHGYSDSDTQRSEFELSLLTGKRVR